MRLPLALALILAGRLAMATAAAAQVANDEPPPPLPIPPRFEVGAVAGMTVAYPEIGVLASVPTGQFTVVPRPTPVRHSSLTFDR